MAKKSKADTSFDFGHNAKPKSRGTSASGRKRPFFSIFAKGGQAKKRPSNRFSSAGGS
jgi:hypothetical protein